MKRVRYRRIALHKNAIDTSGERYGKKISDLESVLGCVGVRWIRRGVRAAEPTVVLATKAKDRETNIAY